MSVVSQLPRGGILNVCSTWFWLRPPCEAAGQSVLLMQELASPRENDPTPCQKETCQDLTSELTHCHFCSSLLTTKTIPTLVPRARLGPSGTAGGKREAHASPPKGILASPVMVKRKWACPTKSS